MKIKNFLFWIVAGASLLFFVIVSRQIIKENSTLSDEFSYLLAASAMKKNVAFDVYYETSPLAKIYMSLWVPKVISEKHQELTYGLRSYHLPYLMEYYAKLTSDEKTALKQSVRFGNCFLTFLVAIFSVLYLGKFFKLGKWQQLLIFFCTSMSWVVLCWNSMAQLESVFFCLLLLQLTHALVIVQKNQEGKDSWWDYFFQALFLGALLSAKTTGYFYTPLLLLLWPFFIQKKQRLQKVSLLIIATYFTYRGIFFLDRSSLDYLGLANVHYAIFQSSKKSLLLDLLKWSAEHSLVPANAYLTFASVAPTMIGRAFSGGEILGREIGVHHFGHRLIFLLLKGNIVDCFLVLAQIFFLIAMPFRSHFKRPLIQFIYFSSLFSFLLNIFLGSSIIMYNAHYMIPLYPFFLVSLMAFNFNEKQCMIMVIALFLLNIPFFYESKVFALSRTNFLADWLKADRANSPTLYSDFMQEYELLKDYAKKSTPEVLYLNTHFQARLNEGMISTPIPFQCLKDPQGTFDFITNEVSLFNPCSKAIVPVIAGKDYKRLGFVFNTGIRFRASCQNAIKYLGVLNSKNLDELSEMKVKNGEDREVVVVLRCHYDPDFHLLEIEKKDSKNFSFCTDETIDARDIKKSVVYFISGKVQGLKFSKKNFCTSEVFNE